MGQVIDIRTRLASPVRRAPLSDPRKGRRRGVAVTASLLLHGVAGWAMLVAVGGPDLGAGLQRRGLDGEGPVVMASLVRQPSPVAATSAINAQPAASAPAQADFKPPQPKARAAAAASGSASPAEAASAAQTSTTAAQAQTALSAAAGASGGPSSNAVDPDFRRRVLEQIERYRQYPQVPGVERPKGVVRVLFTLARSGAVLGAWIQTSSGSAALDREALATLLRSQPLPAIPAGMPERINMVFDLSFDAG